MEGKGKGKKVFPSGERRRKGERERLAEFEPTFGRSWLEEYGLAKSLISLQQYEKTASVALINSTQIAIHPATSLCSFDHDVSIFTFKT